MPATTSNKQAKTKEVKISAGEASPAETKIESEDFAKPTKFIRVSNISFASRGLTSSLIDLKQ